MIKKLLLYIFIFSFNIFANKIEILDENNISEIDEITYDNEEELNKKLEEILQEVYNKGYVGSNFEFEDDKLKLIPKTISEVEFEDNSTYFVNLKKYLYNVKLEGKIFNINDIQKIIFEYNKMRSNKINVDIFPKDNNEIKLKFKNEYKSVYNIGFTNITSILDKSNTYLASFSKEQILGLNDKIFFDFTILKDNTNIETRYNMILANNELDISNKFSYIRSLDIYTYNNNFNIKLKNDIKINKETINLENSIATVTKKQYVRDVKIVDLKHLEINNKIGYRKNFETIPLLIGINQSISNNLIFSNKFDDYIIKLDNLIYLNTKYYNLEIDSGFSKSIKNTEVEYDRYRFSNDLGVSSYPIKMEKSFWKFLVNNKFKYLYTIDNFSFMPYSELALGTSEKTKFNIGASIGMEYIYKNINMNLKYSIDRFKNNDLSLKINVNIGM